MSKIVFIFVLIIGSVLMSNFCERFVKSGKNVVFFRTSKLNPLHVSIGGEYWNINVKPSKNKDSIEGMALILKSNNSLKSDVFTKFDDNLMAFVVDFGEKEVRVPITFIDPFVDIYRFVVIEKSKHKERTELVWSKLSEDERPNTFKVNGSAVYPISWIDSTLSLGMTDMSYSPYSESNIVTIVEKKQKANIWSVVPKWYQLNEKWIVSDAEKPKKETKDWEKKLKALKTNYEMIGVFFYLIKDLGNGLMMFFRDDKTIKWCWLSDKKSVEECKNQMKVLIECSKKTIKTTITTTDSTVTPESDHFPLVWIVVVGIMAVIIIVIVVLILYCLFMSNNKTTSNMSSSKTSISTIKTVESSVKPKTFPKAFAAKVSKTVSKPSKA